MVYFNPRTIERNTTIDALKTASMDNPTSFISGYARLKGLQQAIFILKCFERGFSKEAILEMCEESDGDNIGALGWIEFLKDTQWLQEKKDEDDLVTFLVTKKGKKEIQLIENRMTNYMAGQTE
jgi:hypothetical protein